MKIMDPTYFPSFLDVPRVDDGNMMHPMGLDMAVHSLFTDQLPNETEAISCPVATQRTTQLQLHLSMMEKSAKGFCCPSYPVLDADRGSTYHAGGLSGTELDVYPQTPLNERYSSPSGPSGGDFSSNTESDRSPSPRLACYSFECFGPLPYGSRHALYWPMEYGQYDPDESSVALREVQHYPDVVPEFEVETETLGQKAVAHIYQPGSFSYHNEADGTVDPDMDVDAEADDETSFNDTTDSDPIYATSAMQPKGVTSRSRPKRVTRNVLKRVGKRGLRRNTASKTSSKSGSKDGGAGRQFVCSFRHYGCQSTFTSKNEWKRHVASQHLQLGFYRCDLGLCNVSQPDGNHSGNGNRHPNDFNRKDLFTQHLRRMHSPWSGKQAPEKEKYNEFEISLEEIRQRCWQTQRQPPQRSRCGFCGRLFEGPQSWEERMEHVGKHYEQRDVQPEAEDPDLREWAIQEGIICQDGSKGLILSSLAKVDRSRRDA
ncbi:hypothetical protein VTN77DRAFT_6340 [Rasamsonia byssochlamydoides]|uniref:uncharacterized protein n=1 Tax=Rasamsonia byssochlamydoides TaxID=89139 RepID=UPI003743F30E